MLAKKKSLLTITAICLKRDMEEENSQMVIESTISTPFNLLSDNGNSKTEIGMPHSFVVPELWCHV